MTVDELIEELKKYPGDKHVVWYCGRESEASEARVYVDEMYFDNIRNYFDANALSNPPEGWPKLEVVKIS